MPDSHPDTDQLIEQTGAGDNAAAHELLVPCRPRLRRMVAVHSDRRISTRVDPSDVVQEAFAEAFQRLPRYLQERTISFYP
jgi:RNA polymerase sigma-70 factor (ECF subfamily)